MSYSSEMIDFETNVIQQSIDILNLDFSFKIYV